MDDQSVEPNMTLPVAQSPCFRSMRLVGEASDRSLPPLSEIGTYVLWPVGRGPGDADLCWRHNKQPSRTTYDPFPKHVRSITRCAFRMRQRISALLLISSR